MSKISHHIALRPLLICATAITLCLCPIAAGQDATKQQTLDEVFPRERVIEVEFELDPDDWDEIRKQSRSLKNSLGPERQYEIINSPFTYVRADMTIDGVHYPNVGLRKKGFLGSLDGQRPSLKVNLKKYGNQANIEGLTSLTLNNNKQDTALMSQFIGYELFNSAGSPAPRAALAKVTVNGKNLGIYSHVESMRRPLLNRTFGDDSGTLYEGTVVDFYEDWGDSFERKFGPRKAGSAQIQALIDALQIKDDAAMETAVWKVVDQDAFYKFWAMEGLLSFWDGYSGNRNNFFVYHNPKTDKLYFMPWGADAMFETYSKLGEDPLSPRAVRTMGLLAYRLYQIPSARARYAQTMQQLLRDIWDEEAILAEIDLVENISRGHLSRYQQSTFDPDRIRDFVRNRRAAVVPEITGADMPLWDEKPEPPPIVGGPQSPDESLQAAAKLGDIDAIKRHLKNGVDVNAQDKEGATALSMAAVAGQVDAMRLLIESGADVNSRSKDGGVPLHGAAFFGRVESVQLLLDQGANPNAVNHQGHTPTDGAAAPWNAEIREAAEFWAMWLGLSLDMEQIKDNRSTVALLLSEHGGKLSMFLPKGSHQQSFWQAAKDGDIASLKKYIDDGDDVNQLDNEGLSPLAWAALTGHDDAIELLLAHGADINRRNGDGGTALHYATFFGHAKTVALLLTKGADANIRNSSGRTALATIAGGWSPQMRDIVEYIASTLNITVDPDAVGQAWPGIAQQLQKAGR